MELPNIIMRFSYTPFSIYLRGTLGLCLWNRPGKGTFADQALLTYGGFQQSGVPGSGFILGFRV